jgi:hypothetical protein
MLTSMLNSRPKEERKGQPMGNTFITDLRHFLDDDGFLPEDIPGPALNLALFLGSIVGWATSHKGGRNELTNVPCRRSPARRRCLGTIRARLDPDGETIIWQCPICGDNGTIRGWEDTLWDRRSK